MAKKLTKVIPNNQKGSILSKKDLKFRVAIESQLDNGYCFKSLKPDDVKKFHDFIDFTVNANLTITQIDKLYLRKEGPKASIKIKDVEYELIHYGKDRTPFRIFGYYNTDAYFVLTKIDPHHNVHKS